MASSAHTTMGSLFSVLGNDIGTLKMRLLRIVVLGLSCARSRVASSAHTTMRSLFSVLWNDIGTLETRFLRDGNCLYVFGIA